MHVPDRAKCNWLRERIELSSSFAFSPERKRSILDRLAWSDMFETFLANKYAAAKRFGLEGAESLVPGMKALIDAASQQGVSNVVIGMPHRGRLNILGNVVRKPLRQIFTEFGGKAPVKGSDQYLGMLVLLRACKHACKHDDWQ
jgi:2-oxoglutarate dehydrogenase E1 component